MRSKKMADKSAFEFYATPKEAVLLAKPLMDPKIKWWEPCAGDGAIRDNLPNVIKSSDINIMADNIEQLDVLKCEKPKGITGMITNPPFTLGHDIIKRALFEWKIPALMLMRVEYMAGKNRLDIRKHMTKMCIVSDLIKFRRDDDTYINGNGTGRCAWMLFDPNQTVKQVELTWGLYETKDSMGKISKEI